MEIIKGLGRIQEKHKRAVVVLGFFDGFHLGHQALVKEAGRIANLTPGSSVLVYTFDRHPLEVVNPTLAPLLLTPLEEKVSLAQKLRIDFFLIDEFNLAISKLSPRSFLEEIVVKKLAPQTLVVGFNYRYGKDRQGDASSLAKDAARLNLSLKVVAPITVEGANVSSTSIRKLLRNGQIKEANHLLGRPYALEGYVVSGNARGKALGVPTANLKVPEKKLIPKSGIYAGMIRFEGRQYSGLISIGKAPTFGDQELLVEAHLFDFQENLYGKSLRLEFAQWHRAQEKFPSKEALVRAMQQDIAWGRALFTPYPKH